MRVGAQRQSLHSNRSATHGGVRGTLRLFTSTSALSDSSSNSGRLRLPLEAPPHDYDHRADVLSDTLAVVESRHPELLDLVHKGATTWLRLTSAMPARHHVMPPGIMCGLLLHAGRARACGAHHSSNKQPAFAACPPI
jgi:hypothetical protein